MTTGMIVGIDPGHEKSAYAILEEGKPVRSETVDNTVFMDRLWAAGCCKVNKPAIGIEWFNFQARPVGETTFHTCSIVGRIELWCEWKIGIRPRRIPRREIRLHFCEQFKGCNDAAIRACLLERYGGREKAKGLKADPGPLYHVRNHQWQALAVACYLEDSMRYLGEAGRGVATGRVE